MGCSCKKMDKIQDNLKKYNGQDDNDHKLTNRLLGGLTKTLNKVVFILLFLIIFPIVIICLLLNFVFRGKLKLPLSKINKVNINDIKKNLDKIK